MKNLYHLGLLLTGDSAKAEQCFVSGLEDCATGNRVFKEWARSWARRTVIRNALRVVAPRPLSANGDSSHAGSTQLQPALAAEVSALLDLPSFERFAFVMSVLEGYSDQDCALLLGCTRQTLIAARVHALQQLTRSLGHGVKPEETGSNTKPLHDRSIVELTFPARLATPA
jgi:DNA-directed RNA polymerase specialized sigma24 family protein